MKKTPISFFLSIVMSLLFVGTVIAGGTIDYGILPENPPQANWTAWLTNDLVPGTNIPNEIITEDNTNQDGGEDQGYITDGVGNYYWLMQVENLTQANNGEEVNVVFGTIGPYAGDVHFYNFNWNNSTNPDIDPTFHDYNSENFSSQEGTCPWIDVNQSASGGYDIEFYGKPDQLYYIYRSQNHSDANNDASNGRYFYLTSVTTDELRAGVYHDDTPVESWYIVIEAGEDGGFQLNGCHSEPANPTAAVLSDFSSNFNPDTASIELSWETFSDSGILGFDIYRSDENSPVLVKINTETLLVEKPGGTEGNQYSYTDAGVEIGQTYTYWLDLVDFEGQTSRFGPVTQLAGFKVFVPILQK